MMIQISKRADPAQLGVLRCLRPYLPASSLWDLAAQSERTASGPPKGH